MLSDHDSGKRDGQQRRCDTPVTLDPPVRRISETLSSTHIDLTYEPTIAKYLNWSLRLYCYNFIAILISVRSVQLKLLSILPDSWSLNKITSEINCSKSTAYAARNFPERSPEEDSLKKPGNKPLSPEIGQLVTNFYEDDLNSRQMAGLKDKKSVKKSDGTRELKQKRLILSNLRELYSSFKAEYPAAKIHFTKFASLRPQHCVIAGGSGTHTVCVCITHQNIKLMLEGKKP